MGVLINVFDSPDGKDYTIQPGMQIAHVREQVPCQALSAQDRRFSPLFMTPLLGKPNPAFMAEDLGEKQIEGISAHGIRTTQLGTDEDEWKGKPISISEIWVSDDLAAVLIRRIQDHKRGISGVTRLVDIKRAEPDPSLFEIPSGYQIDPTPNEMPYVRGEGKIVVQPKP